MTELKIKYLKKKINRIISAIDLNYILAEARKEKYNVTLTHGVLKDNIRWAHISHNLSLNYEISIGLLYNFISLHNDKIIKLTISSDDFFSLNRNIIIHVPSEIDINKVKKEYNSVIDFINC